MLLTHPDGQASTHAHPSGQTNGRDPRKPAERNMASGCDGDPTAERHETVPAWRGGQLQPTATCKVLAEATKCLPEARSEVKLLTDSGVENVNETVVMPHGALDSRTPDEVYFGRAEDVSRKLDVARRVVREARLTANRPFRSRLNRQGKGKSVGKSSETNCRVKRCKLS